MKNKAAQELARLKNKKMGKQWLHDNAKKAAAARHKKKDVKDLPKL